MKKWNSEIDQRVPNQIVINDVEESTEDGSTEVFTIEDFTIEDFDLFSEIMGRINGQVLKDSVQFICNLLELPTMAMGHVFSICNEASLIYAPFIEWLRTVKTEDPSQQVKLDKLLKLYSDPFQNIGTPHRLLKYLTDGKYYIPPQEITIEKTAYRFGVNGKQKEKLLTAQYIPLQELLTNFLGLPDVLSVIRHQTSNASSTVLRSFMDGQLWKTNLSTLQSRRPGLYLPLLHYYDDFETCNPLGSKAGHHKIGGNYTVVLALHPRFNSSLKNLLLSEVFHSSDRTQFSNARVFGSIIGQYQLLATQGIQIGGETIFPVLQLCSGDNLSIHGYMGFVESFTANYPCRFCKLHRNMFHEILYDDSSLYRTVENYQADLASDDTSSTGIKEECSFNQLKSSSGTYKMFIRLIVYLTIYYCYIILST